MPIDFETNFVKPFLLDMENGVITDADTFCAKLSEYYENTILQGQPTTLTGAIPATLPSPTLTSAAGGIPTNGVVSTQQDNYIKPNSVTSQQKMYNVLSKYYVARELVLAQENLEDSVKTLDTIIRKQQFNIKRIQALTKKALKIKTQIDELPNKIRDFANAAQAILKEYLDILKQIEESSSSEEGRFSINVQDIEIIDVISNLDFSNIQSVTQSLLKMQRYLTSNYRRLESRQEQVGTVAIVIEQIKKLAEAIVTPESFGPLLARMTSDKSDVQSLIDRAIQSYKDFKVIQTDLQPLLQIIERKIKQLTEELKGRITNLINEEKENIQKKLAEKHKKKKPRHKAALFKQAKTDFDNFQKENKEEFDKIRRKQQTLTKIITKSNSIIQQATSLSAELVTNDIPVIKSKIVDTYANLSGSVAAAIATVSESRATVSTSVRSSIKMGNIDSGDVADRELRQYFLKQGLKELVEPFALLVNETKLSFQDFRVFIEQRDDRYTAYKTKLNTIKTQFYEIKELARTLDDEKVTLRFARETEEDRQDKVIQKELRRKAREDRRRGRAARRLQRRPRQSLVSILKFITNIIQQIRAWINKQIEKFKRFLRRQSDKLKKIGDGIKNALISLVPLRTADADKLTKAQARKEKLERIKQFEANMKLVRDKTMAITQMSIAAGALLNNMASGKYSAKDNEAHLRKIADQKYKFQMIGVDEDTISGSIKAYFVNEDREKFLEVIDVLKSMDLYVSLVVTTIQSIKAKQFITNNQVVQDSLGFIEDLKLAVTQTYENIAGRQATGEIGIVKNVKSNQFVNIIVELFSEDQSFDAILSRLRKLRVELKGELATSLIKSADLTQALVNLESKYLFKVQQHIRQILKYASEETNPEQQDKDQQTSEPRTRLGKQAKRFRNFKQDADFEELIKLDKLISKRQGSFLAALIDRLMILLSEFEEHIRKKVKEFIDEVKKDIAAAAQNYYNKHQQSLDRIKDKLLNAEARVLSVILGLSARVFWAGAIWQNTSGTTFQVLSIGRFPRLKRNGFVDGGEEYLREIASNFEKQLSSMKGIVYPNPAYGIAPFTFEGYGPILKAMPLSMIPTIPL